MHTETLLKQTTSFRDDLLKDLADMEFAMYYLEEPYQIIKKMAIQKHSGQHCMML